MKEEKRRDAVLTVDKIIESCREMLVDARGETR